MNRQHLPESQDPPSETSRQPCAKEGFKQLPVAMRTAVSRSLRSSSSRVSAPMAITGQAPQEQQGEGELSCQL